MSTKSWLCLTWQASAGMFACAAVMDVAHCDPLRSPVQLATAPSHACGNGTAAFGGGAGADAVSGAAALSSTLFLQVRRERTSEHTRSVRAMKRAIGISFQELFSDGTAHALQKKRLEADLDRHAARFPPDLEIGDLRERAEQIGLAHRPRGFPFLVQREGVGPLAREA